MFLRRITLLCQEVSVELCQYGAQEGDWKAGGGGKSTVSSVVLRRVTLEIALSTGIESRSNSCNPWSSLRASSAISEPTNLGSESMSSLLQAPDTPTPTKQGPLCRALGLNSAAPSLSFYILILPSSFISSLNLGEIVACPSNYSYECTVSIFCLLFPQYLVDNSLYKIPLLK